MALTYNDVIIVKDAHTEHEKYNNFVIKYQDTQYAHDLFKTHEIYHTKDIIDADTIIVSGYNQMSINEKVNVNPVIEFKRRAIADVKVNYWKNRTAKQLVGDTTADNKFYYRTFNDAETAEFIGIARAGVTGLKQVLIQEIFTLIFDRLNSNIYKNIFPETIFNMDIINRIKDGLMKEFITVVQEKHGFSLYDVLYIKDNTYYKAIANPNNYYEPIGIVYRIYDDNRFDLLTTGMTEYEKVELNDSGILYLSDTNPGKLVTYNQILNDTYVPIAIYADKNIMINIQQGSTGMKMSPYNEYESSIEQYSQEELDSTINMFMTGVM